MLVYNPHAVGRGHLDEYNCPHQHCSIGRFPLSLTPDWPFTALASVHLWQIKGCLRPGRSGKARPHSRGSLSPVYSPYQIGHCSRQGAVPLTVTSWHARTHTHTRACAHTPTPGSVNASPGECVDMSDRVRAPFSRARAGWTRSPEMRCWPQVDSPSGAREVGLEGFASWPCHFLPYNPRLTLTSGASPSSGVKRGQ